MLKIQVRLFVLFSSDAAGYQVYGKGAVLTVPAVIKSIAQVRPDSKGEIGMKVKDLVPVVINKVQLLYYCAEDGLFPVYKKIGEACYLADMPDELLELEVGLVSVSETLSLDIRVFYTDKDNFAERFEALAQKFAAINEAMTKPGQEPAATETAEPEKEVCTMPAQEYAETALEDMERGLRYTIPEED